MDRSFAKQMKTQLSEFEKGVNQDNNTTEIENSGYINPEKYNCPICSKIRIACPCLSKMKGHNLIGKQVRLEKQMKNSFFSLNKSANSIPKVTFTYNKQAPQKSFSSQKHVIVQGNNALLRLQETAVTKTVIFPREEIIYYPVIHNKFILVTPEHPKENSRKRANRSSYASRHINIKESGQKSTSDCRQPMTPQQFRKLSDYLINQGA